MNERDVKGKNFVFAGGSQGVARATAFALAERGAAILIVARSPEAGTAAAQEAKSRGAKAAEFLQADISTIAGIRAATNGIQAWKPELHGLIHTAIAAHSQKTTTTDGLELNFAIQYLARSALNRLLLPRLAASGDGRIVHVVGRGNPKVNLDDLQYETQKWSLMGSLMGVHHLGLLHLQEAARRYHDLPVSFAASAVEFVKTQSMRDPQVPLLMRLLYPLASTPETSAQNAITLLTTNETTKLKGTIVPQSSRYVPQPLSFDAQKAAKLWDLTTNLAKDKGLVLP